MNIQEIAKQMTRAEFEKVILNRLELGCYLNSCPNAYGLTDDCGQSCTQCWLDATKDMQFKGESKDADAERYFGINKQSDFYKKLDELIYSWDVCLTEGLEQLYEHYSAKWDLAQSALKEITGIEFHFSRTDTYYGICTEDEEFLIKVNRRL